MEKTQHTDWADFYGGSRCVHNSHDLCGLHRSTGLWYKQGEIQLEPGDRLLLFTDGVVEAHDREKNLYGNERLQKQLDDARDCPGEQVLERILDDVNEFARGVPQFDDITMVILTIKE